MEVVDIKGAVSNQIIKCIIYTPILSVGIEKLLEIEEEKRKDGIYPTAKYFGKNRTEIIFDDEEEWIILNPNDGARGYRWRKAWVDIKNVTTFQINVIIKPCGNLYKWEDLKYFNH